MAGRGPQTFKKRQKEQQRKERQAEKLARRLQRKHESRPGDSGAMPMAAAADENPTMEQH